jgi:L,D-peptidoglycan transpeptidase YkuD (ErfK/YbiS/YcfS/YnhG family)
MHIKLINKKLLFNHYKIKCAVGKRGISKKEREGDNITPKGTFAFKSIFYRKDRVKKIKSSIKKTIIKKNMGWCDDPKSKWYNKQITFPFTKSAERLYLKSNIYDIIIVLDYNCKPIIKNKGSAIFIHLSKSDYKPTKGCIALSKKDMCTLLNSIDKNNKITIY